jgi:hypothetical protein
LAKVSAKNAIILVNGFNFSTYTTAFDTETDANKIDVTGFTDQCQNFIAGLPSANMKVDMFYDSTATVGTFAVASAFPTGVCTILPEGYPALGANTVSLPFMEGNYTPQGKVSGALMLGSLAFEAYGANAYLEHGWALAHGTITNTTTGTGFSDPKATTDITAACSATLHIWTACAADTYVVKVQHSNTLGSGYSDLIQFSANGSAVLAEHQDVASGTIHQYRRVLATRTGSAGNPFGFTVTFAHR